ncbi:MAG: LacI family DNA-binding transcriptional regulator [Phycisphaerae bacterium]
MVVVADSPVVRMQDIAKSMGVSVSTVSRALGGKLDENSPIHKQVLEFVDKMGYKRIRQNLTPAQAFKAKVKKRLKGNIAVLASKMVLQWASKDQSGFHYGVINSVQHFAESLGIHLVVSSCEDDDDSIPAVVQNERVDGVIWFSSYNPKAIIAMDKLVPLVLVNNAMYWPSITSVLPDERVMYLQGIDHLRNLGHRRIGSFSAIKPSSHLVSVLGDERETWFKSAINHFGLDNDPALVHRSRFESHEHAEAMVRAMDYFLALTPRPTAIVSELVYIVEFLKECRKRGIRVPEDMSMVAIDESSTARMVDPPLTTMNARREECGRVAAELLFQKIADPDQVPQTVIRIMPELIVRKSTAEATKKI